MAINWKQVMDASAAVNALNYVADMTYCGRDAEWHFKPGYDPQLVLDALATLAPLTEPVNLRTTSNTDES